MTFRPLQYRVLVRCIEDPSKTAGGKGIPDTAQETAVQGKVLPIAPRRRDEIGSPVANSVMVIDRFRFAKGVRTAAKHGGPELLAKKESGIFGVIEGRVPAPAAG